MIKAFVILLILCVFMGGASAAITYDAPNNLITITGYTEATPCTFTDLYNADVAGGWGVVNMQTTSQFYITARLRIGDGTTITWFADTNKHVVIDCAPYSYWWGYTTRIMQNAHFRLGQLIDETNKTTGGGCCLRFGSSGSGNMVGDVTYATVRTGELELYSCQLDARSYSSVYGFSHTTIYDTIFTNNIGLNRFRNASINMVSVSNVAYGFVMITGNISNILCSNIYNFATHYNSEMGADITMRNVEYKNCSKLCEAHGTGYGTIFLIDVISNTWEIEYHYGGLIFIYRQNTFNLKTTPNAKITIMDNTHVVYQDYACDDGTIPEQTFTVGHYRKFTGDAINSNNPYSIEIKKEGYHTYIQSFVLEEPIVWHINLVPECVFVGSDIIRPVRR